MPVKRFIAGAACPSCGAVDKIRAELGSNGLQARECVACGFCDRVAGPETDQPASRLEREKSAVKADETASEKPVRFYKPVARHRKPE